MKRKSLHDLPYFRLDTCEPMVNPKRVTATTLREFIALVDEDEERYKHILRYTLAGRLIQVSLNGGIRLYTARKKSTIALLDKELSKKRKGHYSSIIQVLGHNTLTGLCRNNKNINV